MKTRKVEKYGIGQWPAEAGRGRTGGGGGGQ
jgi:hypothetical protein